MASTVIGKQAVVIGAGMAGIYRNLLVAGPQKPQERRKPAGRGADATALLEAVAARADLAAFRRILKRNKGGEPSRPGDEEY